MLTKVAAPLSVIASWPTPNYVDPTNRGPALEYVCIIFSVLAITIVAARIYSRLVITRAPGWDDFLVVVGLIFSIAMSVMIVIANKLYFSGRHVWDVPPSTFTPHRLNAWISEWLFVFAGTAIKVSVLLFYRRLSVKFKKGFLIATWIGIVYNVGYLVAFTLTLLLICRPVEAYWNAFSRSWAATHNFHCAREGASIPAAVALSVLGDFYSTVLPLVLIFRLPLPLRQKLALYSLFALGFLACALGIVRVVLMNRLLNESFDYTWLVWEMWIWSVVELYVAMFAASAPALKPFFHRFLVDSLNSLSKFSIRRGNTEKRLSYADQEGKRISKSSAGEAELDVERIGVAFAGDESELRERGFWKDIGHQGTRRFEMRSSHNGKIVPMQILDHGLAPDPDAPRPAYNQGWGNSKSSSPLENWPIGPAPTKPLSPPPNSKSRPFVPSQASQQTIQVGLQLDSGTYDPVSALGSVKAARLRAELQAARSPHPGNMVAATWRSSIASVVAGFPPTKKKVTLAKHGANTAAHRTQLTVNRAGTITSNKGSIHSPPLSSRDFDPERRLLSHGRRDGYTI